MPRDDWARANRKSAAEKLPRRGPRYNKDASAVRQKPRKGFRIRGIPVDSITSAELRETIAAGCEPGLRAACVLVLQKRHGRDTPIPLSGHVSDVFMPFGTHEGKPLHLVPSRYFDWLLAQEWLQPTLRDAVTNELVRRGPLVPPKPIVRPSERKRRSDVHHVTSGKTDGVPIVKLEPPYAAVHPVPADVVLDATEECPFDVPETLDDLDVEHMAIVRDEMNGSPRH